MCDNIINEDCDIINTIRRIIYCISVNVLVVCDQISDVLSEVEKGEVGLQQTVDRSFSAETMTAVEINYT